MRIYVMAFTEKGKALGKRIFSDWKPEEVFFRENETLKEWTKKGWEAGGALVYIGATGIAVRAIAPFVDNKLEDCPVLVMDEDGKYVIPILSGHVGGGNELANRIADQNRMTAVITTATDLRGVFAVDIFAKKQKLHIVNKEGIAKVSGKVLKNERIKMSVENNLFFGSVPKEVEMVPYPTEGMVDVMVSTRKKDQEKALLTLKPKQYVLGMGCKKGKTKEELWNFLQKEVSLDQPEEIYCLASVEQKKKEEGLCLLASRNRWEYRTFSAEELMQVRGEYSSSSFVRETIGCDNVCERSAMLAAGEQGQLILQKVAKDGMTAALAKRKWSVNFDEE